MRLCVQKALSNLSKGKFTNFPRQVVNIPGDKALGFMPAATEKLLGYKAVSVFPDNAKYDLNPHQGLVVLIDNRSGRPRAILNGSTVTALRTAAVSAAATDALSRADTKVLGLIGAGRQAFEHALALSLVRPFEKILIYSRSSDSVKKLIKTLSGHLTCALEEAATIPWVMSSADVLVTCTSAASPICHSDQLRPGTHVNAVGACRPEKLEFRLKTREGLKIFMDSEAACFLEASEIMDALSNGDLTSSSIVGELFAENHTGRTSAENT